MKKINILLCIMFLLTCFLMSFYIHPIDEANIEIEGCFYKYLPYNIKVKNKKPNNYIFYSNYINVQKNKTDTNYLSLMLNIQKEKNSNFELYDSLNRCKVITIKPKAFTPPVTVFLNDKYFSGDTIQKKTLIDFSLKARVINFDITLSFPIKSFNIVTIQGDIAKSSSSTGPLISNNQRNALINRDKSTPIVINNIIIEGFEEDFKVDPLVYFVKE